MLVLFDQGTPAPLRHLLVAHDVATAYERGWSVKTNGDLLAAAEHEGFEVLVTKDKNLKYQQSLSARRIAIVVLGTTSWPRIKAAAEVVVRAVDAASLGTYDEVEIP